LVETLSVSTKVHLWWTWLSIAARHAGVARRARSGAVTPCSFEAAESAGLSAEFESSLVATAAVTFAMEALVIEFKTGGHVLDKSLFTEPTKATRGFYVAQRLIQVFGLTGNFADRLPERLNSLFALRNRSVHFESKIRVGTRRHPSGTKTAAELTVFTLEAAESSIGLGRAVLLHCQEAVDLGRHHPSATSVARELTGAITMLDEVIAAESIADWDETYVFANGFGDA